MPVLSEILKKKFATNSYSKAYIASELNVSEKTIENYINGKRSPKPEALVTLATLLNFNLSELSEQNEERGTFEHKDQGRKKVQAEPPPINKDLSSLIESNLIMSRSIEKNTDNLAEALAMLKNRTTEINSELSDFVELQRNTLSLLRAAIQKDIEYKAKGNMQEYQKILLEINTAASENLEMLSQKDKPVADKQRK